MVVKFFVPWQEAFNKGKDCRSISVKIQHSYKDDYFGITRNQNVKWWNKPYFAITNESSTVKFFIDAVINGADYKEAAVYMSKDSKFGLEDLKDIFSDIRNYEYACKLKEGADPDFSTVTLALRREDIRKSSLLHVKMVYEPNRYGKWKIYKIEETFC